MGKKREDLINYCNYPFLPKAAIGIKDLDRESILHCKRNIEKYIPTNIQDLDIPVWLISTIILRNVESNILTRKFVSNYGKLFETFVNKDILNKDIRTELFRYFNIDNDISFVKIDRKLTAIKIHMLDFLELSLKTPEHKFTLAHYPPTKGYCLIERPRFVYLMRTVLESLLLKKIKKMKLYTENELINEIVKEFKLKYPKPKTQQEYINLKNTGIIDANIPPCIAKIFEKTNKEAYLDHNERILVSTFLSAKGFDNQWISENIFEKLSDYNKKVTDYQLSFLNKINEDGNRRYKVKNCSTLEAEGLCYRTDKCKSIINPFNFKAS